MLVNKVISVTNIGVIGQSEEVVIKLPEEFWETTSDVLFTFKVNAEIYLFSANDSKVSGLWEYNVKTETSTKVYDGGYSYKHFKEVPNGVLISAGNSVSGLYFYDKISRTATRIGGTGYDYNNFIAISNDEVLISGSNANDVLIYNIIDNSIVSASGITARYYNVIKYDNGAIMAVSKSSSSRGILKYSSSEHAFIRLSSVGHSFTTFPFDNAILYYYNDYSVGFYHYNVNTEELTLVYNGSLYITASSKITKVGNNFLIPTTRADIPNRVLDGETLTLFDIYTYDSSSTSTVYSRVSVINEDIVILSTNFAYGIISYNNTTKTATQIYDSGSYWDFYYVIGNKAIGWSSTSIYDILSYDIQNNTITNIYTASGRVGSSKKVGENILLTSAYSSSSSTAKIAGILIYDGSTETISNPYTSGSGWVVFSEINDDCLISAQYISGLLLFDSNEMTITKIYSMGRSWVFEIDDYGNFVGTTTNVTDAGNKKRLFYNQDTKSIEIKEYVAG